MNVIEHHRWIWQNWSLWWSYIQKNYKNSQLISYLPGLRQGCETEFGFSGKENWKSTGFCDLMKLKQPDKSKIGLDFIARELKKYRTCGLTKPGSLTKVVLPIRLGKILDIPLIEVLGSRCKYQHRCEVWMVRYFPNTA